MSQGQAFWDRILGTAQSINSTSYYELLGVDVAADSDAVREAYYKLVRTLHPDRHARESAERKRALTVVYARLGEAYRILSAPGSREKYDKGLEAGKQRFSESARRESTDKRDPKTRQGIQLFDKGNQQLAANDKRGARATWELALQYEPDSAAIKDALAGLDEEAAARLAKKKPKAEPAPPEPMPPAATAASDPADSDSMFSREDTRHPLARPVKIRCKDWERVRTLYTRDISRGGMFLRTSKGMEHGTNLRIILTLPDGQVIEIDAEVVRVVTKEKADKKGPGVGIRFLNMDSQRGQLEQILSALPRSQAKREAAHEPAPATLRPPTQPPAALPPITAPIDPHEVAVLEELHAHLKMMKAETPYGRLGVPDGSDLRKIRSAYLRLAKDYHPDLFRRFAATDIHDAASEVFFVIRVTYQKLRAHAEKSLASLPVAAAREIRPNTEDGHDGSAVSEAAQKPAERLDFDSHDKRNLDDSGELSESLAATSGPIFVRPEQRAARPAARPAAEPAAEPAPKPAARPAPRPAARPAPRPAARPAPKPAARPSPRPPAPKPELELSESLDGLFDDSIFDGLELDGGGGPAETGRRALENGQYASARISLQKAVAADPHNEPLRAKFHLAAGFEALGKGDPLAAQQQFETVLIFDKHCAEAIEQLREKDGA